MTARIILHPRAVGPAQSADAIAVQACNSAARRSAECASGLIPINPEQRVIRVPARLPITQAGSTSALLPAALSPLSLSAAAVSPGPLAAPLLQAAPAALPASSRLQAPRATPLSLSPAHCRHFLTLPRLAAALRALPARGARAVRQPPPPGSPPLLSAGLGRQGRRRWWAHAAAAHAHGGTALSPQWPLAPGAQVHTPPR